jgi:hypothetical protein
MPDIYDGEPWTDMDCRKAEELGLSYKTKSSA